MTGMQATTSVAFSLYVEAVKEAERHKWIESQKQGRDLGDHAILHWYSVHWPLFCRQKRLEHLEGRRRWHEFSDSGFGQLYSLLLDGDLLVDRILDRVYAGYENLDLINWAMTWGLPMNRVINILEQIDVNRARLDPKRTLH